MNITEIINKRRYGRIRINYTNELYKDLNELLRLNGLQTENEGLIEIDLKHAKKIVSILLNFGLAYKEEFMPLEVAESYSNYLFAGFDDKHCKCYTNGEWDKFHESNEFGFYNLTDATIDAGVLVSSNDLHFCFWIEEED